MTKKDNIDIAYEHSQKFGSPEERTEQFYIKLEELNKENDN